MDDIELIRKVYVAPGGESGAGREAARAALLARIEAADTPRRGTATRRPRRRMLVGAGAAAGAALVLAVALPLFLLGGGEDAVQPAVANPLQLAARAAAVQPQAAPGPRQYAYTRSKDAYLTIFAGPRPGNPRAHISWSVLQPKVRKFWIAPDGSGRLRETTGQPSFLSPAERAAWVAAGSPPLPKSDQTFSEQFGKHQLSYLDFSSLPTNSKRLRRLIEARKVHGIGGPRGEAETFVLIGDMLRESYLAPALRAALYRVVAELPGVKLVGEVRDPVGRMGTGVAYTDRKRGTRHELIFNPRTSALLGEREILVAAKPNGLKAPPGTVFGYAAYLESRVVDSTGKAPGGPHSGKENPTATVRPTPRSG